MAVRQSHSSSCSLSFLTYHGSLNYPRAHCLSPKKHVKVWPFASDDFHQKLPCKFLTLLNVWISYLLGLGCQTHFTTLVLTSCHPVWLHTGRCRYILSADGSKGNCSNDWSHGHGCSVFFSDLESHAEWAHCGSSSITALLVCGVQLSKPTWLVSLHSREVSGNTNGNVGMLGQSLHTLSSVFPLDFIHGYLNLCQLMTFLTWWQTLTRLVP